MRFNSMSSVGRFIFQRLRSTYFFLQAAILFGAFQLVFYGQSSKPIAKLPQLSVDTTWNPPKNGTTWAVHTSAEFSDGLAKSMPGDIIVMDAGTIYTGNFVVPGKPQGSTPKWIYIQSSDLASLPSPGSRVAPSDAPHMPKIVTPNASQALSFASGANHIRIVGVEIYSASTYSPPGYTPGISYGYYMVGMAGRFPWVQPIADEIILDRDYVHGDSTHDVQTGIQANFSNFAIVDSYVADIHMKGTDTCAVCAFYTPGPILIHNNHLEAAGENVIFGGAGGNNNVEVPSDITITDNHIYKPLSWVPKSTGSNPPYVVKNAFELKSAQRVLFDNNLIENVWASGQMGFAVVLTVRSGQSGDIAVVNDVTITNNILKNVVSGINSLAVDDQCGPAKGYPDCHKAGSQDRWYIANNLLLFYDPTLPGGKRNVGMAFEHGIDRLNGNALGIIRNVVFQHNTMVPAPSAPCWNSIFFSTGDQKLPQPSSTSNIWILDNVLCRPPTGQWGLQGTEGLKQYMGDPEPLERRFAGNFIYVPANERAPSFPPRNEMSQKPPSFDLQHQLTNSKAITSDQERTGFSIVGLHAPLQSALKE